MKSLPIFAALAAALGMPLTARRLQPETRKPGRLTQADHDAIAAAAAKRERKAKKLRSHA